MEWKATKTEHFEALRLHASASRLENMAAEAHQRAFLGDESDDVAERASIAAHFATKKAMEGDPPNGFHGRADHDAMHGVLAKQMSNLADEQSAKAADPELKPDQRLNAHLSTSVFRAAAHRSHLIAVETHRAAAYQIGIERP